MNYIKFYNLFLIIFGLYLLFCVRYCVSQTISPELYKQLYANEYFIRNDSTALKINFVRTDYLGQDKEVELFCRYYVIRKGVYRFMLVSGDVLHIPISNTYGFRFVKIKFN